MTGWGLGEWNDMAWGTGVDYPYAPTIFGAERNIPVPLVARNFPIRLAATDTLSARRTASGGLTRYVATGVIED